MLHISQLALGQCSKSTLNSSALKSNVISLIKPLMEANIVPSLHEN